MPADFAEFTKRESEVRTGKRSMRHMNSERCDGIPRREALRIGGLSSLGIALSDRFRDPAAGADSAAVRARNCILIWLDGGPSHLETFDLKPDAPIEVRGPLGAISTRTPGVHISECLPLIAGMFQDVAVIRSMTSPLGEHNFGTHYLQTGYRPSPAIDYPVHQAIASYLRGGESVLPSFVAVPDFRVGGGRFTGSGYLPSSAAPFSLESDPAGPDFSVADLRPFPGLELDRLSRRRDFVRQLDAFSAGLDTADGAELPTDPAFEQAYRLLTSPDARRAFELSDESPATRQRYGLRTVGQGCLLARRLIERGVPFVTVNHRGWDTHASLYTRLKEGYTGAKVPVGLIPSLDQAASALLTDLKDRGLLDETLVVVMGEFGRTPKLNTQGGRDHWPRVFSVMLAGAGIPGGQVIGQSDAVGESPWDRPVTPADLSATIMTLLGVDPARELPTADGRRIRVCPTDATVVAELIG